MKTIVFISTTLFLMACAHNYTTEKVRLRYYSVLPPENWEIRIENENDVEFTKTTESSGDVLISIHAHKSASKLSIEDSWRKIKPILTAGIENDIQEQRIRINDIEWIKIEYKKVFGDEEYRILYLYTVKNDIRYTVQYYVINESFNEYLQCYNSIIDALVLTP